MEILQFSLGNLTELDGGKAVKTVDSHLKRAAVDCLDRPNDSSPRVVNLTIELVPIVEDGGDCTEVKATIKAASKMPVHRTKEYSLGLRRNGVLIFAPDSPDNVNQTTLNMNSDDQ